jgi:hypothetical protein
LDSWVAPPQPKPAKVAQRGPSARFAGVKGRVAGADSPAVLGRFRADQGLDNGFGALLPQVLPRVPKQRYGILENGS